MIKTCLVLLVLNGVRAQVSFSSIPCRQRIPKIVGGIQAKEHEMPFIVSLMRRGGHFCGGSIIHERWVLTAGHCICNGLNKFLKPTQIHGVAGLHSISKYQNDDAAVSGSVHPKEISFKSIVPHPNYECTKVKNDIALLELLHPVTFSEHIQPTCLSVDVPLKNHEHQLATVSGWGWTKENQEDGHRADVLRKAAVKIWNNNLCEKSYKRNGKPNNSIEETQLCAGFENGGTDSCWADSGGPLIVNENVLIGVVSTGIGCARPGLPGIYTRVSKYTDWIGSVLQKSS